MILHSPYLNPFQPFPEREPDTREVDHCQDAIENNLSRSIFSALGNAGSSEPIAAFLEALAPHGSAHLSARIRALAADLRATAPSKIEIDLQSWPANAMLERDKMDVVLIGISSSYDDIWTHDQRCAPETPQPDAWIYIPGRMLLVFECKNDEHPLDATQISSYAHELKLLMENEGVPRATRGLRLLTKEDAKTVQAACTNVVLDVPWTTVADALEHVRDSNNVGRLGRWLSGNAASYIRSHIYPPYRGTQTVVDWLNGADTPDRRKHLRRLLDKMGTALSESAEGIEDAITFAKKGNDWDFEPGAGSAVYVKLKRGTESVEISWLGRKVHAVLWFQFIGDQAQQVGLEYYLQSSGRCASRTDANSWNEASKRHADSAVTFENELAAWIPSAPAGARMNVSAIRFRGKKRNWQGGGEEYTESFKSPQTTPQGVLDFLRKHRDEFWAFPEVATFADIEAAAGQVRKPSLSLLLSLDRQNFIDCGNDASKLQSLLKRSVEASSADRLSNCGRSA